MKLYATLPPPQIKNLLLVGAGLIGGSLTLALKNAGAVQNVIGIGRRIEVMQHAVELGLIDHFVQPNTAEYATAVASADIIVLAMPVGQTQAVLRDLLPYLSDHTILTDAGSTKQSVYDDALAVLGERVSQFVLAHPIAGREVNGPQAALADLYVNKKIMVCPLPQPAHNTPEQIATVVGDSNLSDDKFAMAGAGFRDFTRIAAASPEMWRDVCLNNRDAILHDLDLYLAHAQQLRDRIAASDGDSILTEFTRASEKRLAWGKEQ